MIFHVRQAPQQWLGLSYLSEISMAVYKTTSHFTVHNFNKRSPRVAFRVCCT